MAKKVNDVTWKVFLDKFSSYEGTVTHFCKENNISKSQFYYHKKRFKESNKQTFHAIALNKEESSAKTNNTLVSNDIKIEIGKANIYIPANEIALLSDVIRELAKTC